MEIITPELAEVCGIHAGDGYLRRYKNSEGGELDISGNIEEKEYYENHVKPLLEKVFNIKISTRLFPHRNTYGFVIRHIKIIEFMHKLGFPYGKKSLIVRVPNEIKQNKDEKIRKGFLRGLFDTDGFIAFRKYYGPTYKDFKTKYPVYPLIGITTTSKGLSQDVQEMLKELSINHFCHVHYSRVKNENTTYRTIINGSKRVELWMDKIGTHNPIKNSKYLVWKQFGFCPPSTTFEQRKSILNGGIDIHRTGPIV